MISAYFAKLLIDKENDPDSTLTSDQQHRVYIDGVLVRQDGYPIWHLALIPSSPHLPSSRTAGELLEKWSVHGNMHISPLPSTIMVAEQMQVSHVSHVSFGPLIKFVCGWVTTSRWSVVVSCMCYCAIRAVFQGQQIPRFYLDHSCGEFSIQNHTAQCYNCV